jgi:Bacterial extracellular solute-binding proteins, family 3
MSFIRVFVSSPGDCDEERKALDRVVERINNDQDDDGAARLRLFKWEVDVIPRIGRRPPQTVVNDQTPLYDIYLGIMSSRFGGDGTRESGTEVEFLKAVQDFGDKGQPWVLFYFNENPPQAKTSTEAAQMLKVLQFKEDLQKRGIVGSYTGVRGSDGAFFEKVESHLRKLLKEPAVVKSPNSVAAGQSNALRSATAEVITGAGRRSRLDAILANKRLLCGATKHPPLSNYESSGGPLPAFSGYYVDLARDVAARNSLQLELAPILWKEFENDLFAMPPGDPRAVDLVLSVFETSERREYSDFTCRFHAVDLVAIVRDDSDIQALDDLRDRPLTWAVAEGEAGWEYAVKELHIDSQNVVSITHPDIDKALFVVAAGAAQVAVVDRLTVERFTEANPKIQLRLLDRPVLEFKNGVMIPRQDKLFEAWIRNEFIASRRLPAMLKAEQQMLAECRGAVRRYS